MLEPFGEQAEPGAIPIDDLDQVGPGAAPEHEQVARERILMQHALAVCQFCFLKFGQPTMAAGVKGIRSERPQAGNVSERDAAAIPVSEWRHWRYLKII